MSTHVAFQASSYPAPSLTATVQYETTAALGGSTVVAIQIAKNGRAKVGLSRFRVKWSSGSAATFTPLIFSQTGVTTAGDIAQEYAGANTAVGTLFDPSLDPFQNIVYTDENGYLYLVLGPQGGSSDNVFKYLLRFLVFR